MKTINQTTMTKNTSRLRTLGSSVITAVIAITLLTACSEKKEAVKPEVVTPVAKTANEQSSTQTVNTPTPEPVNASYNPPVANNISSARPKTAIDQERYPQPLANAVENAHRKTRSYPMQAPTIPHQIEGYQLDKDANQCMSCHSRNRTEESGAIMVSVTHYMNRDSQFLAEISPRRYFCTQCHVVQTGTKPIVESTFIDMHSLSTASSQAPH